MVTWALTGPPAVAPSVCDVPAEAKASRQVSSGASGEGFSQLGREKHIKHCIERTFILKKKKSGFQHLVIVICVPEMRRSHRTICRWWT